jgi:hypothetical protein
MNTPINFELAKLLKEKGWDIPTLNFYFEDGESKENVLSERVSMEYGSEFVVEFSELIENFNSKWLTKKNGDRCFGCSKDKGYFETYSSPAISEVIMWLYEVHGIWVSVHLENCRGYLGFDFNFEFIDDVQKTIIEQEKQYKKLGETVFNSPNESYEAGIEYVLKNLI